MAWQRVDGRVWVGCALTCFSLLSSGCGSWSWSENSDEPLETEEAEIDGFRLYSELGPSCRAAVALSPADLYGKLSFIPCSTGERGCEQLAWDGEVSWNPTGSRDMLQFSLQFGFASTGELRRILITHQYPTRTTDGIPFEAVAYDAASGAPVAAFRNMGDADIDDGSSFGPSRDCLLSVGITSEAAVVLARRSGSNDIVLNQAPLEQAASARTFSPLEADDSVFRRAIFGSGKTAAFEQADGKLFSLDTTSGEIEQSYGPALRLWLSGISGDDVLTRSANPSVDGYYWFRGADSFERLSMSATHVLADAIRVVWLQDDGTALKVHAGPRDTPEPSAAPVIATLPRGNVLGATLGEGVLAVHSATSALSTAGSDLNLVDLATGTVQHRALTSSGSQLRLLASSRGHAFMGQSQYLLAQDTQFEALVRYAVE